MRIDEEKALRLRRTQLQAELARIEILLEPFELPIMPKRHSEVANQRTPKGYPANREQFYRDSEKGEF